MTRRRAGVLFVLAATALFNPILATRAGATLGAGVGASPLELAAPAHTGRSYALVPELLVVNTGTDTAHYELRVDRLSAGAQHTLPAAWIRFAANNFQLAPHGRKSVAVRVNIPSSAPAGSYESDAIATGVAPDTKGHAAAGAAAATTISLTVIDSHRRSFPWHTLTATGALLLLVVLALALKRSRIRLKVERREQIAPCANPSR